MMNVQEVRSIARQRGVNPARMKKDELIRAIQRAEGNFDCFGTAAEEECDQESCAWREDCFFASVSQD